MQVLWLEFWDVLNAAQRKILIGYMRDQHATQGKALAERTAARAKQQTAMDRAESRAAAQDGSTSSVNTAPSGAVTSPK